MPSYLVESYLADSQAALEEARERARSVAEQDAAIRYVRTMFLPGDETILHVFEAPSAEALSRAGRRAALSYERIVEAVERSAGAEPARGRAMGHNHEGDSHQWPWAYTAHP